MSAEDEPTGANLEQFLVHQMTELQRTSDPYKITHTVQVTSFGGSGTTALCEHLLAAGVDLQPGPGQWPFKHRRVPPRRDEVPEGFRVVYLVGEPRAAVLSIFRRGYQIGHFRSLNGTDPGPEVRARLATLETFLAAGVDDFALADHVDGWLHHPGGYPVMFLRYEGLSEAWDAVTDFVGIAPGHPALPTKSRKSDRRAIGARQQAQLDALYGDLAARIKAFPVARVV